MKIAKEKSAAIRQDGGKGHVRPRLPMIPLSMDGNSSLLPPTTFIPEQRSAMTGGLQWALGTPTLNLNS